jgi:hypothetical protein
MMMYLLYCGLLVIWVPLLWPMVRLKGGARLWLVIVIGAGITALVHEIRMYLWSHAAIRLDIRVISVALGCLYGSVAALLFFKHWRRAATLLGVVIILIGSGMIHQWVQASRESQRVRQAFRESNVLQFTAKFRSSDTYISYFGPFTDAAGSHPTGHWQIDGRSHFTRMIINAQGRVWLFYHCQDDADCHSGPGGSGLRESGDLPRLWEVSLKPQVGTPFDIKVTQTEFGALRVEVNEQTLRFAKAPPPVDPAPAEQSLEFFGPFKNVECAGAHAKIRQIWLWGDGARRYAVGIFAAVVAGRHARYIRPVVMGEGVRDGDGWRFSWLQDGRSGTAIIAHKGDNAILTLDQEGRDLEDADQLVLKSGIVVYDERVALAPRTTSADWHHWFDNVLVGHFSSGYIPACRDKGAEG